MANHQFLVGIAEREPLRSSVLMKGLRVVTKFVEYLAPPQMQRTPIRCVGAGLREFLRGVFELSLRSQRR